MNKKLSLAALLTSSLLLTACAKQDNASSTEQDASAAVVEEQITAEQQAAIDAIDQPILDEKNTDIPTEIANAPADQATAHTTEASTSEAVSQ